MTKASKLAQVTQNGPATAAASTRGARRKQRTRIKLLRAAMHLMADKGMEGVAINEITEAADVGFGSFYNHFESKEAIYKVLIEEIFDAFGQQLEYISAAIDDPAEVMAVSIRYTLHKANSEPVWGRFLVRTGFSGQLEEPGLGRHLLRDLQQGKKQHRFEVDDPLMALVVVGGAVLAAISTILETTVAGSVGHGNAKHLGLNTSGIPERVSATVLYFLGLPPDEAEKIAYSPLPDFGFPEGHF